MEHQQRKPPGTNTDSYIVVLGVDDSEHSIIAFKYYAKEVHRPYYKLHIVHCSEASADLKSVDGAPSVDHVKKVQDSETAKVQALQEKFTNLMKEHQIDGEFKLIGAGHKVWHSVIDYQEKVGAIMIVAGNRGANALRRTMMGSVSDDIVHHAHVPVLVCRHS